VTWNPSCAAVVNQCTVTVSPAFMISGLFGPVPSVSIALNAAFSWNTPFWPVAVSRQTGEQTD